MSDTVLEWSGDIVADRGDDPVRATAPGAAGVRGKRVEDEGRICATGGAALYPVEPAPDPARTVEEPCQCYRFSRRMRPAVTGIGAGPGLDRQDRHGLDHYRPLEMLCYNIPYNGWQQPSAAWQLVTRVSRTLFPNILAGDLVVLGERIILRPVIQALLADARPAGLGRLLRMDPCPAVRMRLPRTRVAIVPIRSSWCRRASSTVCLRARWPESRQ